MVPTWLQRIFLVLGQQSVWAFFVLSGLVLTLQMSSPSLDYRTYLPRRLLRLYLPTIAAVVFAYATIAFIPRHLPTGNAWIDSHPSSVSLNGVLSDLSLINGTSGNLMPIWSLKWEVLFSLVLPALFFFLAKSPIWTIAIWPIVGSMGIGEVAFYGAMFISGTFLGLYWGAIAKYLESRRFEANWILVFSFLLTCCSNLIQAFFTFPFSGNLGILLGQLGIPLFVATLPFSSFRVVFESRFMQWLGQISFSLYLVHEPVLIAAVRLSHNNMFASFIGAVAALGAASLFHRFIEVRAHSLSRSLGKYEKPMDS